MPIFLCSSGYKVYFWANESDEPVHFHITKGDPLPNDTKVWIKKDKTFQVAHNKGRIPEKDLMRIMIMMHSYVDEYINVWKMHLGYEKNIN
ncbi:MAG: DUF4160 domain-containing protein [Lachnospiraceae bacterium]|nr:DUF4160 domain-containing protein [Lachnospiraceae bacterium]MEE3460642.1 DUF4160 domain-containing protein [Lachnospiraceae bacterium]